MSNGNREKENGADQDRRSFIRKAAYVAPAILTLKAAPSFASYGSGPRDPEDWKEEHGREYAPGQQKDKDTKEKKEKNEKKPKPNNSNRK